MTNLNKYKENCAKRKLISPKISFSNRYPINNEISKICDAIKNNSVVIITGNTGSGKTTQIPKICMHLKRGTNGLIGHTQPRRIAAQSIANRISKDLCITPYTIISYKVRFDDRTNENTLVKLMTDGILLSEIYDDKLLMKYDTIIIDEAHERSINIDFIIGYLRFLLNKRLDLKIIISSATINSKQFSKYFNNAPVINIYGKKYSVLIKYHPIFFNENNSTNNIVDAVIKIVKKLIIKNIGNILIFVSGEYEIKKIIKNMHKLNFHNTDILPLFASLSKDDQNKIFEKNSNRKIILSTNIAETSLTIPGIMCVIDTGYARISRYNYFTRVQHLPIEEISQSSAEQRAGRCGRISNGICIRLYSKKNFLSRPKYSDPEIMRTNLSSVILQMIAIGIDNVYKFCFFEKPNKKSIQLSIKSLEELNAIKQKKDSNCYKLTKIGKQLIKFPIDPNLSRIILEASKRNCVYEIIVIISALLIQDPREKETNDQKIIYKKHKKFLNKKSDFLTFLKLWEFLKQKERKLTYSEFVIECEKNFINFSRVKEWKDIYFQLESIIRKLNIDINVFPSDYKSIHISLLSGLFLYIGKNKKNTIKFNGILNSSFNIFPNSVLFRKKVTWIIVAKLIKTNKLWGCIAAIIYPEWIEEIIKHLLIYSYNNIYWSNELGCVMALENAMLFNLSIVFNRLINYDKINPTFCREFFIWHVLVNKSYKIKYSFFKKNIFFLQNINILENKIRRKNFFVKKMNIFSFYQNRISHNVTSIESFNKWWRKKKKNCSNYLDLTEKILSTSVNYNDILFNYPDYWYQNNISLKLTYEFDITSKFDGVTVNIPISILKQIKNYGFDWSIPGLRKKIITKLVKLFFIKKNIKCNLSKNFTKCFLKKSFVLQQNFLNTLSIELGNFIGKKISIKDLSLIDLPNYLKLKFCIINDNNKIISTSYDLSYLKFKFKNRYK